MLQRENYILSEYNRLTGSSLEPLMKRCSQDRWRHSGASFCFHYPAPMDLNRLAVHIQWHDGGCPFPTLDLSVIKVFSTSNEKPLHFHQNLLLKSALGRVSCVWRVEKAVPLYFTNTSYPLLHTASGTNVNTMLMKKIKWEQVTFACGGKHQYCPNKSH